MSQDFTPRYVILLDGIMGLHPDFQKRIVNKNFIIRVYTTSRISDRKVNKHYNRLVGWETFCEMVGQEKAESYISKAMELGLDKITRKHCLARKLGAGITFDIVSK